MWLDIFGGQYDYIARVKLLGRGIQFRKEADVVVSLAYRMPEPLGQRERTVAAHVIADRHYESAGHKNVWGACTTKSKCGNLPPAPRRSRLCALTPVWTVRASPARETLQPRRKVMGVTAKAGHQGRWPLGLRRSPSTFTLYTSLPPRLSVVCSPSPESFHLSAARRIPSCHLGRAPPAKMGPPAVPSPSSTPSPLPAESRRAASTFHLLSPPLSPGSRTAGPTYPRQWS